MKIFRSAPTSALLVVQSARPNSAKLAGLQWEQEVGRLFPGALCGQCFKYFAAQSLYRERICQTDFLLIQPDLVVVIECKLSLHSTVFAQMKKYLAVAEAAYGRPSGGIVALKTLNSRARLLSPSEILSLVSPGRILLWNSTKRPD